MKEMSVGDESDMSRAEKSARASRNYRRKMAAFRQEVARRQQAASETAVSAVPAGEQHAQQACAFAELGQAELHGAADDGPDEVEGELADGPVEVEGELAELDGAEAALWQRVDALNSHAASGCAAANGAGDASHGALTRNILGQGDGHVERRTRSHAPHEWAALTPAQRRNIREHGTACVCDHCGASRGFDVELGRAHSLQNGSTAMYGANDFVDHEVSLSVLMAEELMEEHGWRGAITIPKCHRCVFEQALVGSAARSEAAALSVWRQKLDLNMAAERIRANALRLPYVEPAPELDVDTGSGGCERRLGKASVYVMLNKEDVLLGGNDLRRLWYAALTPKLLEGYSPLVVDEALAVDTAAAAVAMGTERRVVGREWAERAVQQAMLMLVVVEADAEGHRAATAAAAALREQRGDTAEHVGVLRAVLREAGTSMVLLPSGARMGAETEALANRAEAQSLGMSPEALNSSRFDRTGAASGTMDAQHVEERLGQSPTVQSEASRRWGSEIEFLAPTDCSAGVKSATMSYFAGDNARARAQHNGKRLSHDGPGQPRFKRVHNSLRGAHLQAKELQVLERHSDYMEQVRLPQMQNACDCLLTLRQLGHGGAPLGASVALQPARKGSPCPPAHCIAACCLRTRQLVDQSDRQGHLDDGACDQGVREHRWRRWLHGAQHDCLAQPWRARNTRRRRKRRA